MPRGPAGILSATTGDGTERARSELGLQGLMELALGYQRAQVLFTANELGLFELLVGGARTSAEVAADLDADPRGVEALLDACVALRILCHSPRGYENTHTSAVFLLPGREMSFIPALRLWQRLGYDTWGRLGAALNRRAVPADGVGSRDVFHRVQGDEQQLRLFCDGLASLAYWPARKVAALVDFSRRRHLLDLGGGSGAFAAAIASRYPRLRITLFDLPSVSALVRERFGRIDTEGRLQAVSGDFFRDPLPEGCDAVLISHVLHDWAPEECIQLLWRVHGILPQEGEIVIHDFMPLERGTSSEASLFGLTLVLDTPCGRVYTLPEIRQWLEQVGFGRIRHEAVTGGTSLLTAFKDTRESHGTE